MISIVGLGGAGNQIANEASLRGFHSAVINFSQRDLDSADNVNLRLKLVGSEGVGKNREEAIRLMENNWEMAVSFIKDNFSHPSTEIIVFVFSTGGGSGSGISPVLLDILSSEMENKTFVAMPIIPDKSEVLVNQMNCLSTFEQLSQVNVSVFPIDNEKVKNKYQTIGKNNLYKKSNSVVVSFLEEILSYTEKHSKNGNLDQKDLLQIFNTKGIGLISKTDISSLTDGKISQTDVVKNIQDSWRDTIFADFEYNQVIRAGMIFDGQEALMDYLQYEKIFNRFNKGMPIDLFEGNYHDKDGTLISILTGLSWCKTRLNEIEHIIEEKRKNAENALEETDNQEYTSSLSKFSTKLRSANKPRKPVGDILSKYKR
jgi:tubulin-like protein CetZ